MRKGMFQACPALTCNALPRLLLIQALAAILLLGVVSQGLCAEKFWVDASGYVLYKNDRGDVVRKDFARYHDVLFPHHPKKVGYFFCTFDGMDTQVPVRDLRVVKRDPQTDYGAVVTMDADSHTVKVPKDLAFSLTGISHMEIEYQNSLTKKNEIGFILGVDILEIHFTDTSRVSK